MNMQLIQQIGKKFMKKVPVIKAGSTVRVHQRIKEGEKERVQIFEGLVIAVNSGTGTDKTFTVRKMVGSIGVEKIFPLYSKNITKIQVTKSSDVRRSKLYYMRKRSGKSARLREKHLTESDVEMEDFVEPTEAAAEVSGENEVNEAEPETADATKAELKVEEKPAGANEESSKEEASASEAVSENAAEDEKKEEAPQTEEATPAEAEKKEEAPQAEEAAPAEAEKKEEEPKE